MEPNRWIARMLLATLSVTLCGVPAMAQTQPAAGPAPQDTTGTTEQLPDAPSAQQAPSAAPPASSQPAGTVSKPQEPPAGTAAAGAVGTVGGAASKPAGMAIAPAKQKQRRGLLLKVGAVLGAAAAIGAVVALSRGTPSTPPQAGVATNPQ